MASPKRRRPAAKVAYRELKSGNTTPLEIMLHVMREAWEAKDIDKAFAAAKDAAPYMHARLQSVAAKVEDRRVQTVMADKPMAEDEWAAQFGAKPAEEAPKALH